MELQEQWHLFVIGIKHLLIEVMELLFLRVLKMAEKETQSHNQLDDRECPSVDGNHVPDLEVGCKVGGVP